MLIRSSFVSRYTQLLEERRRLIDAMCGHVANDRGLCCTHTERSGARQVVMLEQLLEELRKNLYQEHVAGVGGWMSVYVVAAHLVSTNQHSLPTVLMFEEMTFTFWNRNAVVAARLLNSTNGKGNVDSLQFATALGVHRGRLDMRGLPVRTLML